MTPLELANWLDSCRQDSFYGQRQRNAARVIRELVAERDLILDAAAPIAARYLEERDAARAEVERLKQLIDRDRTGLAHALNAVRTLIRGWSWVTDGGWGAYEYTEHTTETLRHEWGSFVEQAVEVIDKALRASGALADEAFRRKT